MIFFDASAAAKLYWQEPGSERVGGLFQEPVPLCSVVFLRCELISALNRRHRQGDLTTAQYDAARELAVRDVNRLQLVPVDEELIGTSVRLLDSHPLKTLDSLYLAGALNLPQASNNPVLFVSADRQLLRVAKAEGLKALDPEKG